MTTYIQRLVDLQNPCGLEDHRPENHGELIEEYTCEYLSECSDTSSRRFDRCVRKDAWLFAMSIADGTLPSSEKRELENSYRQQFGIRVLNNNIGEVILLTEETLESIITNIVIQANNYLERTKKAKS